MCRPLGRHLLVLVLLGVALLLVSAGTVSATNETLAAERVGVTETGPVEVIVETSAERSSENGGLATMEASDVTEGH
ncbi:MAG: hypothetical protein U5K37_04270 [Natrialbaceae archaeon]|nr:hypothetical protein [Natrialbaceae archaeon]